MESRPFQIGRYRVTAHEFCEQLSKEEETQNRHNRKTIFALAMALHTRCGAHSPANVLNRDDLENIRNYLLVSTKTILYQEFFGY